MPKSENTFKFKTFEELIQVDIFVNKHKKPEANVDSYLTEWFRNWSESNWCLEFKEMRTKIASKVLTLNLVLINEKEIIEILFDYLRTSNSLCMPAALDLLQSLVCDIREDFLPYLEESFKIINNIIERIKNDPDTFLSAFTCIAHILMFLQRYLIKDASRLLLLIKPLLFHKKKHVRNFAAQSLAFILRKAKEFKRIFSEDIFTKLVDENSPPDAIGKLMSSCLTTKESLYSSGSKLFLTFYEILFERDKDIVFCINCFDEMFKDMLEHLNAFGHENIWKLIIEQVNRITSEDKKELPLVIIELFFKHAQRKVLEKCSGVVIDQVTELVRQDSSDKIMEIVRLIIDKLRSSTKVNTMMKSVISSPQLDIEKKFLFIKQYVTEDCFELVIKYSLNSFLTQHIDSKWISNSPGNLVKLMTSLTDYVMKKYPISKESQWRKYLGRDGVNFYLFEIDSTNTILFDTMLDIVNGITRIDEEHEEMLWMTMVILPHFYPANRDRKFVDGLKSRLASLLGNFDLSITSLVKINSIMDCLVQLLAIQEEKIDIDLDIVKLIDSIIKCQCSSPMEPLLLEIVFQLISIEKSNHNKYSAYKEHFVEKLKSSHHRSRLNSIAILQSIYPQGEATHYLELCLEIETILEVHETGLMSKERSLFRLLDGMLYKSNMSEIDKRITFNYLSGILHVQFASLWNYVTKVLSSYKESPENETVIWTTMKDRLEYSVKNIQSEKDVGEIDITFVNDLQREYVGDKFFKIRETNWLVYRCNIIKILIKIPDLAAKKTSVLSPILIGIYQNEFLTNKNPRNSIEDTFTSMMFLFSKFPNISGTHSEKQLKNIYLKCLASHRPSIQLAAFQVLGNYKIPELMSYKSTILELLDKNMDKLKELSLSLISQSHRSVLLPIMLRIVVGKLKNSKDHRTQASLIFYLLELETSEIGLLLSILFETLMISNENTVEIVQSGENIQSISAAIRRKIENDQLPTFVIQSILKNLDAVCESLSTILKKLLNKLTNENLDIIFRVILDFYACTSHIKYLETDHPIPQLKSVRQKCSKMILFYFQKLEEFSWSDELAESVKELVVLPQLNKLVEDNQTSANTTIQLTLLWSEKEELVSLISADMLDKIIDLLLKPKLNRQVVGYKLVSIVFNMMQHAVPGRKYSTQLQAMIGARILKIIDYLADRVSNLKINKLKLSKAEKNEMNESTTTRKELLMISIAVEYITKSQSTKIDEKIIIGMVNNIIISLYKSNQVLLTDSHEEEMNDESLTGQLKEQLEVDFIRDLDCMSKLIDIKKLLPFFDRILGLFSRLKTRASKMVLSDFIKSLWSRVCTLFSMPEELGNLGDVALNLNSWNDKRLEEMDFDLMSTTIQNVLKTMKKFSIDFCVNAIDDRYDQMLYPCMWLYSLTCHNCLYILCYVPELGTRQYSIDFLECLIESMASCQENNFVKSLFNDNIWAMIKKGIKMKNESFRYSFIALMKSVVKNFGTTDRFKDIAALAMSEPDQLSFFDNMLSLTTAFNSKGLRQLVRFITHNTVSSINLMEILLPLVLHRIEIVSQSYDMKDKSSLTNVQRESLTSSFNALSTIGKYLPINVYQKLIKEYMNKLERGFNIELVIRTLISLLDGYNADLDDDDHKFMVDILIKLEEHLSKTVPSDVKHKQAQKSISADLLNNHDSEWTIRGKALQVPLAIAIINIAVKLPGKVMKQIITRVILKICEFLKAKEVDIRKNAGLTVFQIINIINSQEYIKDGTVRYLGFVVQTIRDQLNRGFQRHVGLYTCHRVLTMLEENRTFDRLSIDFKTLKLMSEMYLDELFGEMANEKKERNVAEKEIVLEAKSEKAYEGFRLLGNILEKSHLIDFFEIIINASKDMRSESNIKKIRQIYEGLQGKGGLIRNARLDAVSLFTLSMSLISKHVETLFHLEKQPNFVIKTKKKFTMEDMHLYVPPSRLDGDQEPRTTNNKCSLAHLIIDCGLNLLQKLCKSNQSSSGIDLSSMLDPMVPYVIEILNSVQYKSILFSGLKCLKEIIQVNPPSVEDKILGLTDLMFQIHQKISANKDVKDTLDESLATVFYKIMTQIIQRKDVILNAGQFQILFLGIEVDSLNSKREMSSLSLLRAIIEKRLEEPEKANKNVVVLLDSMEERIKKIVVKLRSILMSSSKQQTRNCAMLTIMSFFKNFPQSQKFLQETVIFLMENLVTIDEDGKLAVCLMVQNILRDFRMENVTVVIEYAISSWCYGVTERVEKVYSVLINQVMSLLTSDQQSEFCGLLVDQIVKTSLDHPLFGILSSVLGEILKILVPSNRLSLSMRLINLLVSRFPELLDLRDKLDNQLTAATGHDADLMKDLEQASKRNGHKKRKITESDDEDSLSEENLGKVGKNPDDDTGTMMMDTEDISRELTYTSRNISGLLICISKILIVDHNNESTVEILNYLLEKGTSCEIWNLILTKVVCHKNSTIRLNCTKNVIHSLLSLDTQFEKAGRRLLFAKEEIIEKIIKSSFWQLKREKPESEECDAVLLNLMLMWKIVLDNFSDDVKIDLCKSIIEKCNKVAKDELLDGKTIVKRCMVLKFLAGICKKTSFQDMESLKLGRHIVHMVLREERQAQDENITNKKKKGKRKHSKIEVSCSDQELAEWKSLVLSVGGIVRVGLGEQNFKETAFFIDKERANLKRKRKIDLCALSVSNPGEALQKKFKKSKR